MVGSDLHIALHDMRARAGSSLVILPNESNPIALSLFRFFPPNFGQEIIYSVPILSARHGTRSDREEFARCLRSKKSPLSRLEDDEFDRRPIDRSIDLWKKASFLN